MAASAPPPYTTTRSDGNHPLFARIRLATKSDVPHIHKFIQLLAAHEDVDLNDQSTEDSLAASLFDSDTGAKPFQHPTVFMLEVSPIPFPPPSALATAPTFTPIIKTINLDRPVADPESEMFESAGKDALVAGFVLFYPNYSGFTGKPGFYIEYLYLREGYRGKGMGKMLMAAIAEQAAKMGHGRVDWNVLDWNVKAINLYKNGLGADVSKGWQICRLSGKALQDYAL